MKRFITIFCLLVSAVAVSKEESDSTKHPLNLSGSISINSNGMAPIPAFALGKPALSANLSIGKGRFSYDPQLSYGLDFKPWIIDNWFHYVLVDHPTFELRTGTCISMFFSEYIASYEVLWRGQRYIAFELAGIFKLSKTATISLMVWSDNGIDEGTIAGWYYNLEANKSDIGLGRHFLMALYLQTFYIDYTDNNDGLFISPKVTLSIRNKPVSIFLQGLQPLYSNITPKPKFQWNLGLAYSF